MKKRLIAINLPQFHPFKENDEWWGKGFTEWTNVVKARPRFKGHYQPHIPADTGFYDLRLPEAREMQAEMARKYGIYGFCYYHYWFNGKQLMERPVKEIIELGKPNFPFMLCWANENWTRVWNGENKEILIEQEYNREDDINHIEYLCNKVFTDPRYIRIDNKPFFVIYRPDLIPNIKDTLTSWRITAKRYNIELYLGFMRAELHSRQYYLNQGFDISVNYQPDFKFEKKWWFDYRAWIDGIRKFFGSEQPIMPVIYDYGKYVNDYCNRPLPSYKYFPTLTPSWDNSPRREHKSFTILHNSSPQKFAVWLNFILKSFKPYSNEENFIFINAWNEWAEGNHLEPDQKWGLKYLEEIKKAIDE